MTQYCVKSLIQVVVTQHEGTTSKSDPEYIVS